MKYTPKRLDRNYNISKRSPMKEFLLLSGFFVSVLLGTYLLIGLMVDSVATGISVETEAALGGLYENMFQSSADYREQEARLQQIIERLAAHLEDKERSYRVIVHDSSAFNALALPGGTIVVFSGLINQLRSENEIAWVLGHELGHFVHRDHLRGLGRGLVLMTFSLATLGTDSDIAKIFISGANLTHMKFSRDQERAADRLGLKLLDAAYGHVAGARGFLDKAQRQEGAGRKGSLSDSHPVAEDRIAELEQLIKIHGYRQDGELIPW